MRGQPDRTGGSEESALNRPGHEYIKLKNLLKKLLVPVLASRPVAAFANRLFGCGVPIFMLHRITLDEDAYSGAITPEHLRRCLNYLVDHDYTFISLEHLVTALTNHETLPARAVVFTIDDGFIDQADITVPIFLEFSCPLTFFVITGMLDQTLWPWDAQISWITESTRQPLLKTEINGHPVEVSLDGENGRRRARRVLQDILRETPADRVTAAVRNLAQAAEIEVPVQPPASYRPMDWDMARTLERKGVRFAPHSVSHQILSRLDEAPLRQEILASWESVQRELENPLKVFCYPTGRRIDYGQREIDMLKREGFLGAVSTTPELVDPGNHSSKQLFSLPRLALPHTMDDFIQYCTWIEYAKQARHS